jgi:NodT family efflux transporter outer membrane factor (OMF) lipoprotein
MQLRSLCRALIFNLFGLSILSQYAHSTPVQPEVEQWLQGEYISEYALPPQEKNNEAWRLFDNDSQLQALLSRVENSNLDGKLAWERVLEARAGLKQLRSRKMPQADVQLSASQERTDLATPIKQGVPDKNVSRAALQLGWELDLWGAADAASQAGSFDALAAEEGWQVARWAAQHEAAKMYFIWQGARLRQQWLEQILEADSQALRVILRRKEHGAASDMEVANAEVEVSQRAIQLEDLKVLVRVTENSLATLLGERPGKLLEALQTQSPALPESQPFPAGLPIELIQRRPDLRAARWSLQAETQRLRGANADQWPKLFLGATVGTQDLTINQLALGSAGFSNLALAFTIPIFNSGRLQAQVAQQSAKQRAATLKYEKAVLQALQDVENALVSLQQQQKRVAHTTQSLAARARALKRANALHQEGLMEPLAHIGTHKSELAARLENTEAQIAFTLSQLQLYQAIGSGWTSVSAKPVENFSLNKAP